MDRDGSDIRSCSDIIRVDHFRGFAAYWEIPYGNSTLKSAHGNDRREWSSLKPMKKTLVTI